MKLTETRALLTGATGGIGLALATELLHRGAAVLLVGRDRAVLEKHVASLGGFSPRLDCHAADVTRQADRADLCAHAMSWQWSGVNTLINSAGAGQFSLLDEVTDAALEQLFAINALAPMQLCRDLVPHLRTQPDAAILNIGSVFGSLGYPGFAAYSATKFALRGFTEALHRELADTAVRVHYLAPRATRTTMNAAAVDRMNAELKVAMDSPQTVAKAACDMLEQGRRDGVVGWPEKFFVRMNAMLPRAVDGSIARQLSIIRRHAREAVLERNAGALPGVRDDTHPTIEEKLP